MEEKILAMSDSERIKYYIKECKEAPEAEKTAGTSRKRGSGTSYIVTLSSGLDAVIEKRSGGNVMQMVLMPSQDKYVFMHNGAVQNIKSLSFDDFKLFFTSCGQEGIPVNNLVFGTIQKDDAKTIYNMIKDDSNRLNRGLTSLAIYSNKDVNTESKAMPPNVWKMIVTKTGIMNNTSKYDYEFLEVVEYLNQSRGYDAARVFAEAYTKSSMMGIDSFFGGPYRYYGRGGGRVPKDMSPLDGLETKRLIEYLCFDLYSQGFERIPLGTYIDYITMCIGYEAKVRDKYPAALLTEHDKISLKCEENKAIIDERMFKQKVDAFKKRFGLRDQVMFEYKDNVMILPESPKDLIDEGQVLGHCVGSYVQHVSGGGCMITFVRKKDNLKKSYLTVELARTNEGGVAMYTLSQIQGDTKRTTLTEEEIEFFKKFMAKYEIDTRNRNFIS